MFLSHLYGFFLVLFLLPARIKEARIRASFSFTTRTLTIVLFIITAFCNSASLDLVTQPD